MDVKRARTAGLLLAAASLVAASVGVRLDVDGPHLDADVSGTDPATGAVLIDVRDDAGSAERDEVMARVRHAVEPESFDPHAVATLEEDAELFRYVPPASETADVLAALRDDPNVEGVELEGAWSLPDAEVSAAAAPVPARDAAPARGPHRPNDPYYKYQWHLDAIGMPAAWAEQRGRGATVAVIDTGVLYRDSGRFRRAPDLAQTRFVPGYDFVDGDATPDDEHGHGTHCAGTVAQSTNNGIGVAGVAPDASIMPVRVLDANGSGGYGAIAAAIRWAADHGANVISMSLGGSMRSTTVERAVRYAHEKGVVIVAAAGNAARARVEYPAGYDHVIAVGATRYDGTLSFYSSYGDGLDLVAPGGDIRVDQNGDGMPDGVVQNTMVGRNPARFDYLAWQGTSMATPHVAGVAALLYASGVRDPDAIASLLTRTARRTGDAHHYGAGLVQASAALRLAEQGGGALRGVLALGLSLATFAALRRRGALAVRPGAAALAAFLVAGGLGVLPLDLVVGAGADAWLRGVPGLVADGLGRWLAPVVLSALVPFAASALLLSVKRARPWLVGLALGWAGYLIVESLWPMADIGLLSRMLVGPWLLANAAICWVLARLVARRADGEPAIA